MQTKPINLLGSSAGSSRPELSPLTLSRRQLLATVGCLLAGVTGLIHQPIRAQPARNPAQSAQDADFLKFSRAITGHTDLDVETARRTRSAMAQTLANFDEKLDRLVGLMRGGDEPGTLLANASAAGLRDTALAIVEAWYTGTVGDGESAMVVAYVTALMYRPVQDAQTVPTYCNYGPVWWTRTPPATGVTPPVERNGSSS